MTQEELITMIVGERLSVLLKKESSAEELDILNKGETMIQSLEEEQKAMIEEYTDLIIKEEAETSITAYMGGVHDGIRLMMRIYEIGREENQKPDKNQA